MAPTPSGQLRKKLPGLRQALQDRLNHANQLLTNLPDLTNLETCNQYIEKLRSVLASITTSVDKINDIDEKWCSLIEDLDADQLAAEELAYDATAIHATNGYFLQINCAEDIRGALEARITGCLEKRDQPPPVSQSPQSPPGPPQQNIAQDNAGVTHSTTSPNASSIAHLPKQSLPTFSGNIIDFPAFWSIFEACVDSRTDLTGVTKLAYLMPLLQGSALQAVQGYQMTDANYELIKQTLHERFLRTDDRYISMLYSELRRIPPCSGSPTDKRKTFDSCERVYRLLEQAGETLDPGKEAVFNLLAKFPRGMIRHLDQHYKVGVYSHLSAVRKAIAKSLTDDELTAGFLDDLQLSRPEQSNDSKGASRSEKSPKPFRKGNGQTHQLSSSNYHYQPREFTQSGGKNFGIQPESSLKFTQSGSKNFGYPESTFGANAFPTSACYFCGGSHLNRDCNKYPSASERLVRLQELNRCQMCLQKAHPGRHCKFPNRGCYHCKQAHNSVLCPQHYPAKANWKSDFQSQRYNPGKKVWTRKPAEKTHAAVASESQFADQPTGSDSDNLTQTASEMVNFTNVCSKNSLFQSAKVTAVNLETGEQVKVRICLDTLSNRSYITEKTASSLGVTPERDENLYVSVFGSRKQIQVRSRAIPLGLVQPDGSIMKMEANTTNLITSSPVLPTTWPEGTETILQRWKNCLADDPFDEDKTIQILVGADYAWDVISGPKTPIPDSQIFLIPSIFGFMLGGQLNYNEAETKSGEFSMLLITESHCQFPHELEMATVETKHVPRKPDVDEFWNLESIGIKECPIEDDDAVAQAAFDDSITHENGRYHVGLPWIPEKRDMLPTNYNVSLNRLKSMSKRICSDNELLEGYRETIRNQVKAGVIEKVANDELTTDHPVHYLPHHAVLKKSSTTTKMRIVYDASAKASKFDLSLNECLYRGPVILPDLCQLLIRFRVKPTIVISDVEKAFLQVCLHKPDRDVTRFLWFNDDENPSLDNLATYRFRRVAFGIISSPFLLGATILHHLKRENSEFSQQLADNIYVDNIVSGLSNKESPMEYYDKLKSLFSRAGMNIQQFCSNSDELMAYIPERDLVKTRDVKVLGVKWNSHSDVDTICVSKPAKWLKLNSLTKRGVLQCIAAVFDPLGLFQPVTLPSKLFLQRLWSEGRDWDACLPDKLATEWKNLHTALEEVFDISLPRFLSEVTPDSGLIVFSDASKLGYGAAVYLRTPSKGYISVNLMMAKSRLAPIKRDTTKVKKKGANVTLPRLELLGLHVAARLVDFCRNALRRPEIAAHIFTDSECALQWVYSNKPLKRFVDRRVEGIKSVSHCSFHYVSTNENPADLLTRGTTTKELKANKLWWYGPSWLTQSESQWPETRLPSLTSEALQELKPEKIVNVTHALATHATSEPETGLFGVKYDDYSTLKRLVRVSWQVLKFLKIQLWNRLSSNTQEKFSSLGSIFNRIGDSFENNGRQESISQHVKYVQAKTYPAEIDALHQKKTTPLVKQLNLQLDDSGHLLACSRYQHADLPQTARSPALLPKDHPFSKLVVQDVHERVKHSGVSCTLCELRQNYWIPHGRSYVKKIIGVCIPCRRCKGTATFQLPPMPPWPQQRVMRSAPFQFVGLDYFGPLKIKLPRSWCLDEDSNPTPLVDLTVKIWVSLFTCLSTRAVHLEPVTSQDSPEFLQALVRFVSRRGCPQQITSDNAAQFRLTQIIGDRAWDTIPTDDSILSYCAEQGIEWKFITELAPWQGGHYERLVGVVKSVLKSVTGRRLLTWTDLVTLLAETEAIVNSRPITYVSSDLDSSFRVLRPVDFLLYRPISSLPPSDRSFPVRDLGEGGKLLAAIWKSREHYLEKLWSIWYDEYLLSLRERSNRFHKTGRARVNRVPIVGEVVILREDGLPRGSWKLARVTGLRRSADDHVRAAEVQLWNGVKLQRAVNFLLPLEVTGQESTKPPDIPDSSIDTVQPLPSADDRLDGQSLEENDPEAFYGFSQADVDHARDLLQLYSDPDSEQQ
jgi:hypothetical protein